MSIALAPSPAIAMNASSEDDVLDLAGDPRFAAAAVPARIGARAVWAVAIVCGLALVLFAGAAGWGWRQDDTATIRVALDQQRAIAALNVDDKAQIVVEGAAAEERNAAIPLSGQPLENVRGFLFARAGADTSAYGTALRCLTQAVYYEAATEPLAGRRAVAQVVLNRMRHPAYPRSVCGVVYQGSERRTGCQFSFTCDGSLLRPPMAGPWREAAEVARAALAGYVEPEVGTATHYHADYVLPKWAFTLGKIEQIGRHIFYRFNGGWGRSSAFSGVYSGVERIPALNFAALRERSAELAAADAIPGEPLVAGLTVPPHPTDRHAATDVGGRIDVAKTWRLTIPDPVQASSGYRSAVQAQGDRPAAGTRAADAPVAAPAVALQTATPPSVGG